MTNPNAEKCNKNAKNDKIIILEFPMFAGPRFS